MYIVRLLGTHQLSIIINLRVVCCSTVLFFFPFSDQICGRPNTRIPRIVGGQYSPRSQIPWIVSIRENRIHRCGGSLITDRIILTAAHCFHSWPQNGGNMVVSLDSSAHSSGPTEYSIDTVINHPDYDPYSHFDNDIALVKIKERIQWTPDVLPICLPKEDAVSGLIATASGWGLIRDGEKICA